VPLQLSALAQLRGDGTLFADCIFLRRGGRAVDRAGLENRKAERSREFESHPLRALSRSLIFARTVQFNQRGPAVICEQRSVIRRCRVRARRNAKPMPRIEFPSRLHTQRRISNAHRGTFERTRSELG
jgi:hypothetical protein